MKLLKILAAFVLLLVLVLFVAGFFVDGIARSAIESAASEALGVPTTVDGCHVGLLRGTFGMDGLAVAQPEGFGEGSFLTLRTGGVAVTAGSLLSDRIELPTLALEGARVVLIQRAQGSNYGTILDNLERARGADEAASEEGRRFVIESLVLDDIEVRVVAVPELGLPAVTVPVPRIELNDVGSETEGGVLLSELAGIVVQAILERATGVGGLPDLVRGGLKGQLGDLEGTLRGELDKRLEDATKGATDRLKGLLGK